MVKAKGQSLVKVLKSVQHIEEVRLRAEDKIASKGERLARQFPAILLEDRGFPAHFIDLSYMVKQQDISTKTLESHMYRALADSFRQDIHACGIKVPVITGYFGNLAAGILHIVGRGYRFPMTVPVF